jgi:chemotaxis protein methyltransferase CheR
MIDNIKLTPQDFNYVRDLVEGISGINLTEKKIELIRTRLRPRLMGLGCKSFAEYRNHMDKLSFDDPQWTEFINAFTTNKTDFFRSERHFSFLQKNIIPQWLMGKNKTFKAWSCACSSGEEPYSLAMLLNVALSGTNRDYKILATDVNTNILSRAAQGVFPFEKLENIPEEFKFKSFDRGTGSISNWSRIKPELKNSIHFVKHNLIENTAPTAAHFDVVFCSNVLIYFSKETCEFVLEKLYQVTRPGGYLMTGSSESLQGFKTSWKMIKPSIYIKRA